MKKLRIIFILLFFCLLLNPTGTNNFCFGFDNQYNYTIFYKDKIYEFKDSDFKPQLTKTQQEYYHKTKIITHLERLNFSNEEILNYVFPEIKQIYQKLSGNFDKDETEDEVYVIPNKCKLEYSLGECGINISKVKFYEDIFNQIKKNEKNIKISLEIKDYKNKKSAKELFCEKSSFSTNFASSSEERKNNIRVALKSLDGVIVEEGEIFSFNNLTGERNEESGYKQAKIITNGTYSLGFGGGVCQVSTTLYNACLLSDLEIIESTSHSLPVSYIEPSFDAMVSFGSSDLKVRNNSGGKLIITTSSEKDICKIKIFGLKNKYKITRQSEKFSITSAETDYIETDYLKYGDYNLNIGEEKRISYPKDGFSSRGYLNYYDTEGNLVKRKLIRENHYNPTRGVVIKREN